ncbi:Endonuclease-reverse transcriptase [Operophtera brumata]|uniref:Endonuclease-reverse transcriptase n=1 Tax=Operophtera brumata TaxID=104452 RepID=A0A0L7L9U0_OPEBR|nr:Endonuclease-reverse transcriptase [Operophtera brumata]
MEAKLTDRPPPKDDANANTQWEHLKNYISDTFNVIWKARKPDRKRRGYISKPTWVLIQQRKDLKIQGLQNARVAGEYAGLCRSIDRHCRADKNNFIQGICEEIEVHCMKFQTADLFKKVRLLSR